MSLSLFFLLALPAAPAALPSSFGSTCATATPAATGSTSGLVTSPGSDDYYTVTAPGNAELRLSVLFSSVHGDLDLELYEPGCGVMLASSYDVGSDEVLEHFDCGGAPRDLVLRVVAPAAAAVPYSLVVESSALVDDSFEDNDSCAQSVIAGINTFTTRGLEITECDPDFYLLRVADQREVRLDLFFDHLDSDVNVRLFDPTCTTLLDRGNSNTDGETVTWFNRTGQLVEIVAEVTCQGGRRHARYDMAACYSVGDQISFPVCVGETNSTGRPATMCARGSAVAANNFVLFIGLDLPSQAFGYFVTSTTTDYVPFAGNGSGTLCLGATGVGRYDFDVLLTSTNNAVFYQPDLTRTPTPDTFIGTVAGDTRYWQFWYRDSDQMGGVTSNFSSAVGVTFL